MTDVDEIEMPTGAEAATGRAALLGATIFTGAAPTRDRDGYRPGEAPAAPVAVTGPASTATTALQRLVDSGWDPPVDGLRQIIRQIDSLRAACVELRALSGVGLGVDDPTRVAAAVRRGDREAIVAAATRHAIGQWLQRETNGQDTTTVATWLGQLTTELWRLLWNSSRRVRDSIGGRTDPDAASLLAMLTAFETYPTCPKPSARDYLIQI